MFFKIPHLEVESFSVGLELLGSFLDLRFDRRPLICGRGLPCVDPAFNLACLGCEELGSSGQFGALPRQERGRRAAGGGFCSAVAGEHEQEQHMQTICESPDLGPRLTLSERKYIDPADIDKASVYRLMTSAIVPRPIAWVGTTDGSAAGVEDPAGDNLAPFSYFMGVSSAPPLLAVSVARGRAGTLKHTARNILATSCFSVSIPSLSDLTAMHATGGEWAGSEFEAVGVLRAAGQRIRAPRPANALFTMECELHHALDLESTHLFVGRVVLFSAAAGVLRGLEVDAAALAPIARLGGDAYAELGTLHHIARTAVQDVARGAVLGAGVPRSGG